jgi:hypothetical protein
LRAAEQASSNLAASHAAYSSHGQARY